MKKLIVIVFASTMIAACANEPKTVPPEQSDKLEAYCAANDVRCYNQWWLCNDICADKCGTSPANDFVCWKFQTSPYFTCELYKGISLSAMKKIVVNHGYEPK